MKKKVFRAKHKAVEVKPVEEVKPKKRASKKKGA